MLYISCRLYVFIGMCAAIILYCKAFRRLPSPMSRPLPCCRSLLTSTPYRTEVLDKVKVPWKIDHSDELFFIGSCFSENISHLLRLNKFCTLSNPQGILFNPVSIEKCIVDIASSSPIEDHDIVFDERSKVYHAWDSHSDFSSQNRADMVHNIIESRARSLAYLRRAKTAFITLGTSKVPLLKICHNEIVTRFFIMYQVHCLVNQSQRIVANCHQRKHRFFISAFSFYY